MVIRNFATLFDAKYKAKGLALLASLRCHLKDFHLYVLALDEPVWEYFLEHPQPNVTAVPWESFETDRLRAIRPARTYQEFVWTLASVWTLETVRRFGLREIAYLDSDTFLFSNLAPLYAEVGEAPCAIIPHRWTPRYAERLKPNGTYNVSWVWFGARGMDCLQEWAELCLGWCYARNEPGRFADQGYWDTLVPKYSAHVVNHLGVGLAPWNSERYIYVTDDFDHRELFIEELDRRGNILRLDKLLLYHFHQLELGEKGVTRRSYYPLPEPVMRHVYDPYEAELLKWL